MREPGSPAGKRRSRAALPGTAWPWFVLRGVNDSRPGSRTPLRHHRLCAGMEEVRPPAERSREPPAATSQLLGSETETAFLLPRRLGPITHRVTPGSNFSGGDQNQ